MVTVGETTATVGIANSLVSAVVICRCRNCGTKPATNATSRSSAPPDIRITRCLRRARIESVLCSSEPTPSVGEVALISRRMCLGCGNGLLKDRGWNIFFRFCLGSVGRLAVQQAEYHRHKK